MRLSALSSLACTVALFLGVRYQGCCDITYSDGAVHVLNSALPQGTVYLYNSSTLSVESSGEIQGATSSSAYGVSIGSGTLNVFGGSIRGGVATNYAIGIEALGTNSMINMYGGSVAGGAAVSGFASAIELDGATMNMYGGTVLGGTIRNGFAGAIQVIKGSLNIYGGKIDGGSIAGTQAALPGLEVILGTVLIYGSDFNYGFGPVAASSGTISGILSDRSPITLAFTQFAPGEIILIPEPSIFTILILGINLVFGLRYISLCWKALDIS